MLTTNEVLARVMVDVQTLIQWAQADREHSLDQGATAQAADDGRRGRALQKALALLSDCGR